MKSAYGSCSWLVARGSWRVVWIFCVLLRATCYRLPATCYRLRAICSSVVLALLLGGCSSFFAGVHDLQENNLAYVYCAEGSGPPLTGEGRVVAVGLKQGFEGVIAVKAGCEMMVDHYLPYKEKVEELRRKSQSGGQQLICHEPRATSYERRSHERNQDDQ